MQSLITQIRSLSPEITQTIDTRLKEFQSFSSKDEKEWFSELCFCILTANSRATTALAIQKELQAQGFLNKSQSEIVNTIIRNKHRFHNNKARYIVEARAHRNIKTIIAEIIKKESITEAREWLVKNVKGLGYKESSHFLRNTGHDDIAILDRHILNLMKEHNIISEVPKPLTKNNYLEIESKFNSLCQEAKMSPARLDLAMWYLKTGEVLK